MLVDQVNGALNTFLDERKKEKTLTMKHIDEIVRIYNSVKPQNHGYYNAIMSYNQYKATVPINIQDANQDLIDIKIQDYYSAIKLPIHGNITTTGHITIFHLMQPIIPYSNIIFKLTFRKLTTPEKSNIGKRLISKLSECEATFSEPAFREGNSPDMQAPYLRVFNGVIPRVLTLDKGRRDSSYNIIIFSETSDDNKEITIRTIHPITIISYNSNVNIELIYINPPNDNCPKIEPVIPNYRNDGTLLKPVAECINNIDNIIKKVNKIDIQDIDKLMNEYEIMDPEDLKKVTGKEFNQIHFTTDGKINISDVDDNDMIVGKSAQLRPPKVINAIKQTANNDASITFNNVKCHLCVFSFTHPQFPYSNIKMNIKLNKKDNINVNSPSPTQKLVNYVVAKLYPLSLKKNNNIRVFHDRPTTIPSEKRDLPAQIDLTDVNSPPYSILIFDNINNKNVIINTIYPVTIMSLDSDINIQLTYLNPYTDGPNPLCPVCPECPVCKTCPGCPKPTCPMCKTCASCGKKKK